MMQCYKDALLHESSCADIQSISAKVQLQYGNFLNRFNCSEKLNTILSRLDFLNQRIEYFWDSENLQAEETDTLSLRLQQNRFFPAIRSKLIMARLGPYESNKGRLLRSQASTPLVASVLNIEDHGIEMISATSALQALQSLSSNVVLKMITKISGEIPLCIEEVEAISHHLNSRFKALNPRISCISRIQEPNPSR